MSTLTADKELEPEVNTKTVQYIESKYCDGCGISVAASYEAVKGDQKLFFCGHHIRKHAETLKKDGYEIIPEDTSYEASVIVETSENF